MTRRYSKLAMKVQKSQVKTSKAVIRTSSLIYYNPQSVNGAKSDQIWKNNCDERTESY